MRLLETRGLKKHYGGVTALDGVDFHIDRGEITAMIGPNGAGKTTFFDCITGITAPDSGDVIFGDYHENIRGVKPHRVTTKGIARTFQNIRLFPNMSVIENVAVGAHCRTSSGILSSLLRLPGTVREESEVTRRAAELLDFVGLGRRANELASALPYGLARRLEIARALATEPELLLLDEPAAGMTSGEKNELIELIRGVRKEGVTVLLIDHDMRFVMPVSERVTVLDSGAKIAEGTPREIQNDPRVIDAYLGTRHRQCSR